MAIIFKLETWIVQYEAHEERAPVCQAPVVQLVPLDWCAYPIPEFVRRWSGSIITVRSFVFRVRQKDRNSGVPVVQVLTLKPRFAAFCVDFTVAAQSFHRLPLPAWFDASGHRLRAIRFAKRWILPRTASVRLEPINGWIVSQWNY